MADGIFDPSTGPSDEELSDWFHKDVMGRTDEEILVERQKALDHFEEQFGLDLELENVVAFGQDPRTEYRAYQIAGYRNESESPIVPSPDFGTAFLCRVTSDSFEDHGGGLAQGVFKTHTADDGRQISNIRNVITFPGLGFEAQDLLQ